MAIKFTISDEDVLRNKMVKPGWAPVLIKDVRLELSSKRDSQNVVVEGEYADNTSEYYKVPFMAWLNEKVKSVPGGMVSFATAMLGGNLPEGKLKEVDFEMAKGMYLYAKWGQVFSQKEGQPDTPRNAILDWAPLPAKYGNLASAVAVPVTDEVPGF